MFLVFMVAKICLKVCGLYLTEISEAQSSCQIILVVALQGRKTAFVLNALGSLFFP